MKQVAGESAPTHLFTTNRVGGPQRVARALEDNFVFTITTWVARPDGRSIY